MVPSFKKELAQLLALEGSQSFPALAIPFSLQQPASLGKEVLGLPFREECVHGVFHQNPRQLAFRVSDETQLCETHSHHQHARSEMVLRTKGLILSFECVILRLYLSHLLLYFPFIVP